MKIQDLSQRLALTRVEAAQFLGISPATIDRLAKRGVLHPSRAIRRPIYSLAELHRFLQESSASFSILSGASGTDGKSLRKEVK